MVKPAADVQSAYSIEPRLDGQKIHGRIINNSDRSAQRSIDHYLERVEEEIVCKALSFKALVSSDVSDRWTDRGQAWTEGQEPADGGVNDDMGVIEVRLSFGKVVVSQNPTPCVSQAPKTTVNEKCKLVNS